MKQLLQRLDTGEICLIEAPVPAVSGSQILVETRASLISPGTERMLVDFGQASLLKKARSHPHRVRQVLDKVRTEGLVPTIEAVRAKLEAPIPLGYCQAGVVVDVGPDVHAFKKDDRVVTNGPHAQYVRASELLAARIPDGIGFEAAAFTPLAAIALQGIRLIAPTLGETVVVYGLGLIGLLAVQLLRANGCRVIGIDRDPSKLDLARRFAAVCFDDDQDNVVDLVRTKTGDTGADAVLLTLASHSDEPVRRAAAMSRKRGRLVLVGVTGLNLERDAFYEKELSFQVSCSYGPGRHDPTYEEKAHDYPLPFVRWTEQRNFEAVLQLMASGGLDPLPLITHRYPFERAIEAYDLLAGKGPHLGIVFSYEDHRTTSKPLEQIIYREAGRPAKDSGSGTVGVIGSGQFGQRILLPALRKAGARLHTIASSGGTSAAIAAEEFGFSRITTDVREIFQEPEIDTVFVLTRHDSHGRLTLCSLQAGKHTFVEKPLALSEEELDELEDAASAGDRLLMVGFNRRFAPLTAEVQRLLRDRTGPLTIVATINAGMVPRDHWIQDPAVGGGRIVGEACHHLDLARALVGASIREVYVRTAADLAGRAIDDIAHLSMSFADGSTAVVNYLASGARSYPKERVECYFDGRTLVIENWRRLKTFGFDRSWKDVLRRKSFSVGGVDKGHESEVTAWLEAVRSGGPAPIPLEQIFEVSRWAIRAGRQALGKS